MHVTPPLPIARRDLHADPLVARLGWVLVTLVAAAGLLHGLGAVFGGFDAFHLDRERNAPAALSAAFLAAGGIAFLAAVAKGRLRPVSVGLAALLLLMAADELLEWHETLERRTGVDWQLLYAPVGLAGALVWLLVMRQLRGDRTATVLLAGGAAAWALSQVLERVEWDGGRQVSGYGFMMPVEELLELSGSAMFLLAAMTLLRSTRAVARRRKVARV